MPSAGVCFSYGRTGVLPPLRWRDRRYNASQTYVTTQEIASYQIALWTGIGLVLVLLGAMCCMVNMEVMGCLPTTSPRLAHLPLMISTPHVCL